VKIVLVGRSIAHFSYYQSIIRSLSKKGHRIQLLYDKQWSRKWPKKAIEKFLKRNPNVSIEWSKRRKGALRNYIFFSRELLSFISYLQRSGQSGYYLKRWQSYLPSPLRPGHLFDRSFIHFFFKRKFTKWLLKSFENLLPPDKHIKQSLMDIKPDVVVVTPVNMRYSEEIEYLKAAKHLKIPTILPVLSWDNLTTKGLIHICPDRLLVWNEVQKNEAQMIHQIPEHRIEITGSPFFDKWFTSIDTGRTRSSFCDEIGLSPKYPIILYLGSSANIIKDESWLVRELCETKNKHPDDNIRNAGIIVRPHPANYNHYVSLDCRNLVVLPKNGALPEDDLSKFDFYDSLKYCSLTVGVNTSGMLDAIINKKPCVAIKRKEFSRTQEMASHFKSLVETDALSIAESTEDFIRLALRVFADHKFKQEKINSFIASFVRPVDIESSAGEIAAKIIEEYSSH
jgi:hypothetical protein